MVISHDAALFFKHPIGFQFRATPHAEAVPYGIVHLAGCIVCDAYTHLVEAE